MKRTINKPKKKSPKKKLEIKKNSKPLNKTKKDKRDIQKILMYYGNVAMYRHYY